MSDTNKLFLNALEHLEQDARKTYEANKISGVGMAYDAGRIDGLAQARQAIAEVIRLDMAAHHDNPSNERRHPLSATHNLFLNVSEQLEQDARKTYEANKMSPISTGVGMAFDAGRIDGLAQARKAVAEQIQLDRGAHHDSPSKGYGR